MIENIYIYPFVYGPTIAQSHFFLSIIKIRKTMKNDIVLIGLGDKLITSLLLANPQNILQAFWHQMNWTSFLLMIKGHKSPEKKLKSRFLVHCKKFSYVFPNTP